MDNPTQLANPHKVPVKADSVASPIVHYGDPMTAIHFITVDGRWGRITFERLESLRVSRGEYAPYSESPDYPDDFHWVTTISNSAWLRERYEYEKRHYGSAYNFSGNVDEMLDEYYHYVFSFHDEFVEVIAAGIWFETDESYLGERDLNVSHPLKGLTHLPPTEHFEGSGIRCIVRQNSMLKDELDRDASLCSQTILEIKADLGGSACPDWTLTRRVRNGIGRSYLRSYFGKVIQAYDGIPTVDDVRIHVDKWLAEVRERRQKINKP